MLSEYNTCSDVATLQVYATVLVQLSEDWEIARQEVMLEHSAMVSQYRQNKSGLQAQLEAGVTFKKSTSKSEAELDFVPVNLHVQEMKVIDESTGGKGELLAVMHLLLALILCCSSSHHREGPLHCGNSGMPDSLQPKVSPGRSG